MDKRAWWAIVMVSQIVGHHWATNTHFYLCRLWYHMVAWELEGLESITAGKLIPQVKWENLTSPTFDSVILLATCWVPSSAGSSNGQRGTLVPLLYSNFRERGWKWKKNKQPQSVQNEAWKWSVRAGWRKGEDGAGVARKFLKGRLHCHMFFNFPTECFNYFMPFNSHFSPGRIKAPIYALMFSL